MGKVTEEVDLESAISDVAAMANVCVMAMDVLEENERGIAKLGTSAKAAAEYLSHWREAAYFSVLHLRCMTDDLEARYYASVE